VLDVGGKFIRPILMILSCEAIGENYDKILPGASGIESRAVTIYLPTFYDSPPAF
jgi:geranylgeranyl pyrophosphate synthase